MTDIPLNEQIEAVRPYIEEIRAEWNGNRQKDWAVLERVSDLYTELGAYHAGLTRGLMQVFHVRDESSIYNYRDAWRTRSRLRFDSDLGYSYFVAINRLQKKYGMTDEAASDWLKIAEEDSQMSVRDLSTEIEKIYTEDLRAAFLRRISKIVSSITVAYNDSESVGLPAPERTLLKGALEAIRQVMEWGN